MLLQFLSSMVGYLLVHRILVDLADEFALTRKTFLCLSAASVGLFVLSALACSSPLSLWIFIGILLISLNFFPNILRLFLSRRLAQALIPLLDHLILGLQSGKSFRIALSAVIETRHGWMKSQLREIYSSMTMGEEHVARKSALLKGFTRELCEIDQSGNRVIEQVKALRRQLKLQEDFRRRSGQVTQQIKMQAIIVTALYLGLLSFIIFQFGWQKYLKLLFFSSLLFLFGLVFIFHIGRRMKWKV